jgi:hypothetical protein
VGKLPEFPQKIRREKTMPDIDADSGRPFIKMSFSRTCAWVNRGLGADL